MRSLNALAILCFFSCLADAPAQDAKQRGVAAWATSSAKPQPKEPEQKSNLIPPGYHAHRRIDGTVIVHKDNSDAASHAGVASPWVQIAGAGEPVPADLPVKSSATVADGCPPEG